MNTKYYLFARVNCPSANDDSYYMKIDDGPFVTVNGLGTVGWQWYPLTKFWSAVGQTTELTAGDHTLTITYREDGALLDKICITSYIYGPYELGGPEAAINIIESEEQVISMWPPDHTYATVNLSDFGLSICTGGSISADDIVITKVTSDEAENDDDDGNTVDDIVIADDFKSVDLRKERSGTGNGRVYTIHVSVSYQNDNVGITALQVHVPLDDDTPVVDDGPVYEVLGANVPGLPKAVAQPEITTMNIANVPAEFNLEQNFPNPFNPTTTIQLSIPKAGFYTLKVYNTLGREVAELLNRQMEAGFYSLTFDASGLATGMYIYNLKGNNVNLSKKLLLNR
jgi:hypothetical protein